MKKLLLILVVLIFSYTMSFAGQEGVTKAPHKTNHTNVFRKSFQPSFTLPDGISVEILGIANPSPSYPKNEWLEIKVLEGEHKDKIGIVGKDNISKE